MRYSTRDLLTLLISLFTLSACENPSGIGLDENPGRNFYGILNDTVTLKTVTVRDDSALTASFDLNQNTNTPAISVYQLPFGYLKDPVLGETQADVAFDLARSDGDVRLPANAQIDSAVLILRYGTSFVGDSLSSTYQVEVKQLDEVYNPLTAYYASKKWTVKDAVVGSAQIHHFNLTDSVGITLRSSTGTDSAARVAPQLRIKLDNNFISALLSSSLDSATVNTESGFRSHVKGFYLTTNTSAQEGMGGLATLLNETSASGNLNGIEISYRTTDTEGKTDTVSKRFPIVIPSSYSYASTMTSSVSRIFSTQVQNALANRSVNQTTVYAQSLGGLRTQISFPYLEQLKGKKIAINKAELVVYVDEDQLGDISPAPRLTLYRSDIAGTNRPIPDGDARPSPDPRSEFVRAGPYALGGFYDKNQKRYIFSLTSYIQDILLGKMQNSPVYIAPVFENPNTSAGFIIPFWSDINSPSRVVLKGYNPEDAAAKKEVRTKLNIYYTELD